MRKKHSGVCPKCGKELPDGYKYKRCEACRNVQIENVKKYGKTALGALASVAVVAITKGKINPKGKS